MSSAIIRRERSIIVGLKSLTEHNILDFASSFYRKSSGFLVDDLSLRYMTNVRVVVGIL